MTSQTNVPPIQVGDQLSCDMLVVGAGVVGLWIARLAARAATASSSLRSVLPVPAPAVEFLAH